MHTVQLILVLNNRGIPNLLLKRIGLITVEEFDFQEIIPSDALGEKANVASVISRCNGCHPALTPPKCSFELTVYLHF